MPHPILPQSFYARPARELAPALLGQLLVRQIDGERLCGRIVETEAYCDSDEPDLACHGTRNDGKPTSRTAVMFGPPGHAYVYFTYGNHWMFNIVCGREGQANAVLIRAIEPISGLAQMAQRRGKALHPHSVLSPDSSHLLLTNGPGKLAQALAINKTLNGTNLFPPGEVIWLEEDSPVPQTAISTGPRVGLGKTPEPWFSLPWRYWLTGNPFVSAYR